MVRGNVSDSHSRNHDVIIKCDLENIDSAKKTICDFEPDVFIHLAWDKIPDFSKEVCESNLEISKRLIDFVANNTRCKKIIVSGTCHEYDANSGECSEADPETKASIFGKSKLDLLNHSLNACAANHITLLWFRIFYVYGEGMRDNTMLSSVMRAIANRDKPVVLKPYNRNDYIYVVDVADALYLSTICNNMETGIYNLGAGKPYAVWEIVNLVERKFAGSGDITESIKRQTGGGEHFWANMSKTTKALNWHPTTDLEQYLNQLP